VITEQMDNPRLCGATPFVREWGHEIIIRNDELFMSCGGIGGEAVARYKL
jgi:hypothetical protein